MLGQFTPHRLAPETLAVLKAALARGHARASTGAPPATAATLDESGPAAHPTHAEDDAATGGPPPDPATIPEPWALLSGAPDGPMTMTMTETGAERAELALDPLVVFTRAFLLVAQLAIDDDTVAAMFWAGRWGGLADSGFASLWESLAAVGQLGEILAGRPREGSALDLRALEQRASAVVDRFRQGSAANGISAAAIKATFVRFGPRPADIFLRHLRHPDGRHAIQMRDGFELELSAPELWQAREASDFRGPAPAALESASILYAAQASRLARERPGTSFAAALRALATGLPGEEVFRLLGLEAYVRPLLLIASIPVGLAPLVLYPAGGTFHRWGSAV